MRFPRHGRGTFWLRLPAHAPLSADPATDPHIAGVYGGRVRVRVGALVFDDEQAPNAVLLVEHESLHADESGQPFWTPPGGGVEFGEPLAEALRREVREEANLSVRVGPLRYVLDFVRPPLHAVSCYFECYAEGGTLRPGSDPELGEDQLIRSLRLVPFGELAGLNVYPEGFSDRLPTDARAGFPWGTQYLGTLR